MIKDFLVTRDATVLRRVYLLIDSRRGPNEDDCYMIELLTRAAITHQVWIPFFFLFFLFILPFR
jgi:GTP-binding protein EngB required for normal cell division